MTFAPDVTLHGAALSSLDDSIRVLDIREEAPHMQAESIPLADGTCLTRMVRQSLSLRVSFAILEANITRRQGVVSLIAAWAIRGGLLTLTSRPGQQLRVLCSALPALEHADWTQPLSLTFTTHLSPWWEDAAPTAFVTSEVVTAVMPGQTGDAPVSVTVDNLSGTPVTSLTLRTGSTQMTFRGISLPASQSFLLDADHFALTARIGTQSVLSARTADSDDLLLAPCGQPCTLSVQADQPVRATFSVRGRSA